jgi:hypothetical protein
MPARARAEGTRATRKAEARVICKALVVFGACLALASCSPGEVGDAAGGTDGGVPGTGTGTGPTGGSAGPPGCVSTRTFFAQEVWTPLLDKVCINCHAPDGIAAEQNAELRLLPSSYPGFLDANLENLRHVARFAVDGKPVLLQKPLGQLEHGGGKQLDADSTEYAALEELVARLGEEETCAEAPPSANFDDVILLDAAATFRKAALQLAGRLPTPDEATRLTSEGEAALVPVLDALVREQAFLSRLKDIYNDMLLSDLYLRYVGFAINLLSEEDYPQAGMYYEALDEDLRRKINTAIAREPLELIAHVVRNDRPFSEILTADYTVVNPFSARVYELAPAFDDPNDEDEFREAKVTIARPTGEVAIPHAGVLTAPVFLHRFPTTPTNRNRHRARKILDFFLATDVLRVAERPIDAEASSKYNNPTRDDPQCAGCHRQIDPIAGAFMKWHEYDQERLVPEAEWYPEMFPPGYGPEVMDTSDYPRAQQWLAARLVADPRFVLAAVYRIYEGITGHEPLAYPENAEAADFEQKLLAWERQDAIFRATGDAFVAAEMNLKVLVREVVLTPYFRAANAQGEPSAERAAELVDVGTGRLTIPERLARKIQAVTGVPWAREWDRQDWLTSDYNVLYGGIDSESVTERLTTPNGIMANVGWRMANEVACGVTATDFNRPQGERLLFPYAGLLDLPETDAGYAVPAAVENVKRNIQHLHARVLDERLPDGDPEIERTYGLFLETWREGRQKLAANQLNNWLDWRCQARLDPETGAELPEAARLTQDDNYVVRAWMAVMTYLLADYRFLYE